MNSLDRSLVIWGIALIVGTPLLTVALGEIGDRLEVSKSRYVRSVRLLRTILIPAAVGFVIIRNVLAIDEANAVSRVASSVILVIAAWVGFIIVGVVNSEADPSRWENRLPGLFKTLARVGIVVYPLYLLANVWGLALSSAVTALGVGSIVIAFALQDTLSSMVSGFLLVIDKPFAVGDWVTVDGHIGKVLDISWRSTRLQVNGHDMVVIPNVNLSSTSILNHTAFDNSFRDELSFGFDSDHPPNQVKSVLLEVAKNCPEVAATPPPEVHLSSYDDWSTAYTIIYMVPSYEGDMQYYRVREDLRTRVFYAAERAGLSMPLPTEVRQIVSDEVESDSGDGGDELVHYLSDHPYFSMVPVEVLRRLAPQVSTVRYGQGETVLHRGRIGEAFYLVRSGEVQVRHSLVDDGPSIVIGPSEVLGEMALMGTGRTEADCVAQTDVTLVQVPPAVVRSIVEQVPPFARKLTELIESRMKINEMRAAERTKTGINE